MEQLQKSHSLEDLFRTRIELIRDMEDFLAQSKELELKFKSINGHTPFRIDEQYDASGLGYGEQKVGIGQLYTDRILWRFVVKQFNLEKYMLATHYQKMMEEVQNFKTPEFTIENVNAWLNGLKSLIHENVKTLVKSVFKEITEGTYHTGSGYNAPRKKRNNNGVDKMFILRTNDHFTIDRYYNNKPTITDDLEKVCYILDGKVLPKETLKNRMSTGKVWEAEDDYMKVKVYQNGNTHYTLKEEVREKLNLYGPTENVIGENIKIKIFDRDNWNAWQ